MISSNSCYVCKRTEDEVNELLSTELQSLSKEYDSEIHELESQIREIKNNLKSRLDKILKETENTNLNFKIETVKMDIEAFKKLIPSVEELLELNKEFVGNLSDNLAGIVRVSSGFNDESILKNIRDKIKVIRERLDDDSAFEHIAENNLYVNGDCDEISKFILSINYDKLGNMYKELTKVKGEKEKYLNSAKTNLDSIKKTKHHRIKRRFEKKESGLRCLRDDDESRHDELPIRIEFPVCVICHTLVWHRINSNY